MKNTTTTVPQPHVFTDSDVVALCEKYDVEVVFGGGTIAEYLVDTLRRAGGEVEYGYRHIVKGNAEIARITAKVTDELVKGYSPSSVEWIVVESERLAKSYNEWRVAITKVAETCHALSMLADESLRSDFRSALRDLCFGEGPTD